MLAFHRAADASLAAIAGLKTPGRRYRHEVFTKAEARASAIAYELELGWVFVAPGRRREGIGDGLCRRLLARVPEVGVFATTRPDNDPMVRILVGLGFRRVGRAYPHVRRNEDLVLFLRPARRLPD